MIKLFEKHYNDGSLAKHNTEMKQLNKDLRTLKKLDKFQFLPNGKYFKGLEPKSSSQRGQ